MPPAMPKRTASEVIAGAIRENRFGEHLIYLFAGVTLLVGLGVLGVGVYRGEGLTEIVGTMASFMFYPAMRLARRIREQNMAIMLLEIPLNNSKTAEEAAQVLKQFFESTITSVRGPSRP
jgi:hypothetical protein